MKIPFSEKEYRDLVKMSEIANSIFGILGDLVSDEHKEQSDRLEELQNHILKYAKDFICGDLVENYKGKIILKETEFEKIMETIMDDYDNYIFWDELEKRLSNRDMAKELTKEEKEKIKSDVHFWIEKSEEYYQKYREEFEKHGIERLEIKNKI